jgi:effector-binding domain-containing protein
MNFTENPEIVTLPATHYVFVEKTGPFMNSAPQAWQEAHTFAAALSEHNPITGAMSLYKMRPQTYRAGFILAAPPVKLPAGLSYTYFDGGKYVRFVLTGSYSNLPEASRRAWATVAEKKIQLRDDWAIENYTNDPKSTPEAELVTEILLPTT